MSSPFKGQDVTIIVGTFLLFLFSILSLYQNVAWIAYVTVLAVDIYFVYVIFYAARKSDVHKSDDWVFGSIVPYKFAGVFVFVLLYASAVVGLAEVLFDQG